MTTTQPAALQPAEVSDADVWALWLRVCNESENLSTRVMIANFARAILALRPAQQATPEPVRPDIIERLTYHQLERDDLSLDDCLDYLASGWKKVHGRTERQMVMQILALLAGQPATPEPVGEAVASIYITPGGDREFDDWKHDLPVGRNILYTHPAPAPQQVPMSRDDLKVLMSESGYVHVTAQEKADFINGFRAAERHHGITAQAKGEPK